MTDTGCDKPPPQRFLLRMEIDCFDTSTLQPTRRQNRVPEENETPGRHRPSSIGIEREKLAIRERLRRAQELYHDQDTTREQFRVKSACLRDLKALAPAATPTGGEALALLDNGRRSGPR